MVIIGSGAAAVTLAPALAPRARQVTVLQRSPSYVLALPSTDRRRRGERLRNAALTQAFYTFCRRRPEAARRWLLGQVARRIGERAAEHFTRSCLPWDQRLCNRACP